MSASRRRGTNFQPLEVQALLRACLTHQVEEFRRAGKCTGPLFYDIQREMAARGDFPARPLNHLRAYYTKVERSYKRGRKPYPPEARQIWGRLEGEGDVSENDAAWLALTQKKMIRMSTCTYLTKLELVEVFREALQKDVESIAEVKQKAAFESMLVSLHSKKLFLGRNADDLQRAYLRLKKRFLKGKYDSEFPESAVKLWSRVDAVASESVDDFPPVDYPEFQNVENGEVDTEAVCSICQGSAFEAKHLFRDVYQNQTYAEIINQTLNVKMLWNGYSSAVICLLCSTYVEGLPVFRNQCRESCDKLNIDLMTKQEPQPSFCETTSGAGTPPNDNEEANSLECKDFQTNDTLDEISVKEETLPVEDSNLQVDAQPDEDPTEDARNMLNFKESRCKYWKRKPKQCELCGKTVLDLKSHINSHYKNKPEACDFCSKRFTNRNQLLTHRNKHTRERKYPCSYCGAVYDSWMGKNYHEKAHIAEINNISYDCDQCEATFSVEKNLRNHVKFKHLNMRKLQCLDCDFSTITKVRLRNHVRSIHSKERPFRCPYCNFTSNSNTGYFIHFKRHKKSGEATEYRIKCGYCEEMFSKDAALEKHIVREHPDRAITV